MSTARFPVNVGAVLLVLASLSPVGCSRSDRASAVDHTRGGGGEGAPLDTALVAFLSEARAQHHRANLAEADGSIVEALAPLRALVSAPHPTTPEVDEVLADTYARLAELELERGAPGDPHAALEDVNRGLAFPAAPYFRGHLLEVQGTALEAEAEALADAGDVDAARNQRARAKTVLEEAVRVQDDVIRRALADAGAPP